MTKELTEEEKEKKYAKPPFGGIIDPSSPYARAPFGGIFKLTKNSIQLQITPITDEVVLLSESGGYSPIVLLKDYSQSFKIQGANADEILKKLKRFKKTESILKALKKAYPLLKSSITE